MRSKARFALARATQWFGIAATNTDSAAKVNVGRLSTTGEITWFDPSEISSPVKPNSDVAPDSAFVRLWRSFTTARVTVAVVLLLLQIFQYAMVPAGHGGSLLLCCAYLTALIVVQFWVLPVPHGSVFDRQWMLTIGMDGVVFAVLQWLQPQSINYTPLLALPVLLASVMGSLTLALGTTSAVTLYLLGLGWRASSGVSMDSATAFFQAGLTGMGYFAVAILANQLATRLLREEQLTRRSQHAIRVQTQVNELVIEALTDGVMVVDARGVVRAANPAAQRLMAPAQRVLTPPFALTEEPGWLALRTMATGTFFRRAPQASDLSLQHLGEAARRLHVRTRLTANDDDIGESLCVVFMEDLPELEARMRQEKMVAMGRMSAAVAHEIRNPLAAITQANALLAEDLTDPIQQRLTTMIGQNAQRLARIVDDVLNIAHVPRHSAELAPSLSLDEVVSRVTQDWCQQNHCGHKTQLRLEALDVVVAFDTEHLRRVLINLLDNARRYASDRPHAIVVATQLRTVETPSGAGLTGRLRVWSDGEALDPTVQHHLFEPFFSSESRSSGLGLYICRELCERHGAVLGYVREPSRASGVPLQAEQDAGKGNTLGNTFFVEFKLRYGEASEVITAHQDA